MGCSTSAGAATAPPGNYLPKACRGCVVVHKRHPLILGTAPADAGTEPFLWDTESEVFTVVNTRPHTRFTYLTFCGVDVLDRNRNPFEAGSTRDEEGQTRPATTFVVVAGPKSAVSLGYVQAGAPFAEFTALPLARLLAPPSIMGATMNMRGVCSFGFPLPDLRGPYLCTQGVGGHLTHFFPGSYHAIDLRCGHCMPVLSVSDGIVEAVDEQHRCGGVHCANLMAWNAVSVRLSSGLVVEFLHTRPGSARVKVGDRVRKGQVLCETGDIGFSPEPHLHIEVHHAGDMEGPSVPFSFATSDSSFVPVAGRCYSHLGEVAMRTSGPRSTAAMKRRRRRRGTAAIDSLCSASRI